MKLKVPAEVRSAMKDIDLAKFARTRREIQARERGRKKAKDSERLRQRRAAELRAASAAVFGWVDALAATAISEPLAEIVGKGDWLVIFGAMFWQGEPTDDRHCWATLSIKDWNGIPQVRYEERYNSAMGSFAPTRRIVSDIDRLVGAVPPDFLVQCRDHLYGPGAWEFILRELGSIKKSIV